MPSQLSPFKLKAYHRISAGAVHVASRYTLRAVLATCPRQELNCFANTEAATILAFFNVGTALSSTFELRNGGTDGTDGGWGSTDSLGIKGGVEVVHFSHVHEIDRTR